MVVAPVFVGGVGVGVLALLLVVWVVHSESGSPPTALRVRSDGGPAAEQTAAHAEKPSGVSRWLTTVDHKDIGVLYGIFAVAMFAWAGMGAVIMRAELFTPTLQFIEATTYNSLMTNHGITMLFLFSTPVIAAFGNYFIPLLVGADDMAFPRINAIAFWLLPPSAFLIWGGYLIPPIDPAQTGWTMYTPLSIVQPHVGADLMFLGLHLSGLSATMGAINFIATIFTERAEDVTWANLDIFSWTMLTQSAIIIFAFPILGSALIMLLLDRNVGTVFFAPEGGSGMLWQHLFWFFGHPEVYILVLPPMGLVSYILPRFAGRRLFGFRFVVYSTLAIGVLSFGVWAHHMFSTGMDPRLASAFMATSLAIAVPSAVKTFNWITTMWNGKVRLTAPMLFCVGFVSNFIIGGITGVFLASIPVDLLLHDTYYVVGHFHYIVMGAIASAVFAGIYYWFPIYTGRMYNQLQAKAHFWLTFVGTNVTFFAMLGLGYLGMPRRYATFEVGIGPQTLLTSLHQVTTVGAFILLVGQLIFVANLVRSWYGGPTVGADPWDLRAETPELYGREFRWHEQRRERATVAEREGDEEPAEE